MTFKEVITNAPELLLKTFQHWTDTTPRDITVTFIENGTTKNYPYPNKAKERKLLKEIIGEGKSKVMSHARLMPSLTAESMVNPFSESYVKGSWLTVEEVQDVSYGVEWEDRTDLEKELLTLMGREGAKYFMPSFKIVKVSWTEREGYNLPYARIINQRKDSVITCASYMKHISGALPYSWCAQGLTNSGDWELCGLNHAGISLKYNSTHPYTNIEDGDGAVYVALPGTVDRFVDLTDPENWAGIIG